MGDGFSRNPSDRDALIAQRTTDLEGRTGQLRGFTLEGFLSDYEEGERPSPWTVSNDAVPEKVRTDAGASSLKGGQKCMRVIAAGPERIASRDSLTTSDSGRRDPWGWIASQVGVRQPFLVLYAQDAVSVRRGDMAREKLETMFGRLLDCRTVSAEDRRSLHR